MGTRRYVLSERQIDDLRAVQGGADIFAYDIAFRLRALHEKYPDLLEITKPAYSYGPGEKRPYFGCIATRNARRAISGAAQ